MVAALLVHELLLSATLQLVGQHSSIVFGQEDSGPRLSATCGTGAPGIALVTPTEVDVSIPGNVTVHFKHVATSCNNVPSLTPCVHDYDAFPALFWCRFSGATGDAVTGPFKASTELV